MICFMDKEVLGLNKDCIMGLGIMGNSMEKGFWN